MFDAEKIQKAMPEDTSNLFLNGFSDLEHIDRWTLVGGTALSIYYQHRLSEDLDFFIEKSSLDQEKKYIKSMIAALKAKGFSCVLVHDENDQMDYQINNAKVTFYASGLKNLKDDCIFYENINVASISTIIAMKMDAIINYRIKSRDFYDIYTISNCQDLSIFEMLDLYKNHTNENSNDTHILKRFAKKPLNIDDEGLQSMKAGGLNKFTDLRAWAIEEIERNNNQDIIDLQTIEQNTELITKYKNSYFGLERLSLPQKFAATNRDDLVIRCLELSVFDTAYRNIVGKNLLDYYSDNTNMFQKILEYTKEIPDKLMAKDPKFMSDGEKNHLKMLKLEYSIINCAKRACNDGRMHINSSKFEISFEEYSKRVKSKRDLLNCRGVPTPTKHHSI